MMKLIMLVFVGAIVALPAGVQGAPNDQKQGVAKKAQTARSVPEPATMLLVGGAAAALVGARKLLRSKRR